MLEAEVAVGARKFPLNLLSHPVMIRDMRGLIVFLLFAACCPNMLKAQSADDQVACYAEHGKDNTPHRKKLWDGYEVSLGPARNSAGGGDECTAAIYNRAGRVVYRTTGFNVVFDEDATGEDFDGDGHPEVVFKTDTGGGNHCCWAYHVVSLWPRPHKLLDIDQSGAVDFRKDQQGRMVIWTMQAGPYGYTSMAENPFAQRVFRVQDGKLVDITPDYCTEVLQGDDFQASKKQLTPEKIARFKAGGDFAAKSLETSQMANAVLAVALQHVFCQQFDRAMAALELWPETTKAKMKADFAKAVEAEYPDFAVRLTKR